MKTEIAKYFTHGFILTEQDLTSINEDIAQQMKRETNDDIISFFEVKYKSGVKAEKASLNEVISENNSKKWEIQMLKMGSFSKSRTQRPKIEIEFRVPPAPVNRDNTKAPYSIYYYISGDERDWVYLTSSKLDDSIAKIKRLPLEYYGVAAIFVGAFIGLLIFSLTNSLHPIYIPLGYKITAYLAAILFILSGITTIFCFSRYNFCWGHYLNKFSNRQTTGKNILYGIILAFVISVLGGVFGTLIFLK
jgi:hypothetical protein